MLAAAAVGGAVGSAEGETGCGLAEPLERRAVAGVPPVRGEIFEGTVYARDRGDVGKS